jgi:uncharacterized protein GlcG (DUF336 family)
MEINLATAKKIITAGIEAAKINNILCSIAVVDDNGWLVALHRMDGALIPTADIAHDKAWTAAVFKLPTSEVIQFGSHETPGAGFNTRNWNDRLTIIPGGLPVEVDGRVIGGIGVCGGTPDQDVSVCHAAIIAVSM